MAMDDPSSRHKYVSVKLIFPLFDRCCAGIKQTSLNQLVLYFSAADLEPVIKDRW